MHKRVRTRLIRFDRHVDQLVAWFQMNTLASKKAECSSHHVVAERGRRECLLWQCQLCKAFTVFSWTFPYFKLLMTKLFSKVCAIAKECRVGAFFAEKLLSLKCRALSQSRSELQPFAKKGIFYLRGFSIPSITGHGMRSAHSDFEHFNLN
jgi:hypothetical protein